jgi:4'-phosphopantetheinyl transferase
MLSKEKLKRILRYRDIMDAQTGLIGEILVRYVLCDRYGLKNEAIEFVNNDFGKPSLRSIKSIKFNISHSGEWVVCAVGEREIGIDIEMVRPIDIHIAKRVFTAQEYNKIKNTKEEHRLECFYRLWTCKESYIKALGSGLSTALNSFSIEEKQSSIKVRMDGEDSNFTIRRYFIDKNYEMAVCSPGESFPDEVNIFSFECLFDKIQRLYLNH